MTEQKLLFENAWDRTISLKDRQMIIDAFADAKEGQADVSLIREADNHLGQKLVTVIIHNRQATHMPIKDEIVSYESGPGYTGQFTLPMAIPAYHSMPWTFIFSTGKKGPAGEPFLRIHASGR